MAAVWKARKSKSPFPLFPHCLGKLAKTASFPHSHSFGDDLGFPFSPSSFNFNFNEKCYLLARYLLLPTCPFAHQPSTMGFSPCSYLEHILFIRSVPGFPTHRSHRRPLMWFSLKRTTCS